VRAADLQHLWGETPGSFGELLTSRGYETSVHEPNEGDLLPDLDEVDLVLVMGGAMGANDVAEHPFLIQETRCSRATLKLRRQ